MIPNNIAGHTKIGGVAPGFNFINALESTSVASKVTMAAQTKTETWTLSIWAYHTSMTGRNMFGGDTVLADFVGFNASNTIRVEAPSRRNFIVTIPTLNQWYNYVITNSASGCNLYIDSNLVGTLGSAGGGIDWLYMFSRSGVSESLRGKVDETGLWLGTEANQTQVDGLWNNGDGADAASIIPNPVYHLKLDGEGAVATNDGSAGDGVLSGYTLPDARVPH